MHCSSTNGKPPRPGGKPTTIGKAREKSCEGRWGVFVLVIKSILFPKPGVQLLLSGEKDWWAGELGLWASWKSSVIPGGNRWMDVWTPLAPHPERRLDSVRTLRRVMDFRKLGTGKELTGKIYDGRWSQWWWESGFSKEVLYVELLEQIKCVKRYKFVKILFRTFPRKITSFYSNQSKLPTNSHHISKSRKQYTT